jgi:hypothetical protein
MGCQTTRPNAEESHPRAQSFPIDRTMILKEAKDGRTGSIRSGFRMKPNEQPSRSEWGNQVFRFPSTAISSAFSG